MPPTPVTYAASAVLVAVFVVELLVGATDDVELLLRMGAVTGWTLQRGEIYRLLSSELLHGSVPHILFNGMALRVLGRNVELLFGGRRLLVILTVSAIGASLASAAFSGTMVGSVGASGAIVGLIGALLTASYRKDPRWARLPLEPLRRSMGFAAVSVFVFGAALGGVGIHADHAGHAGGLVAGALVALGLGGPGPRDDQKWTWPGAVCVALWALSAVGAGLHGGRSAPDIEAAVARQIVEDLDDGPIEGADAGVDAARAVQALVRNGQDDVAEDAARRLASQCDGEAAARASQALLSWDSPRYAVVFVDHALAVDPTSSAVLAAASWYEMIGAPAADQDMGRALAYARDAVAEAGPDDPSARAAALDTLGAALANSGRAEEARPYFEEAFSLAREHDHNLASGIKKHLDALEP